jgi:alkylation response protein AidB-like acyl-CoA dehydrogenase
MIGPTLLRWGSDEQRRHFVPRILSGQDRWCQGYSEPNAGSDLGGLGCRARLVGGEWVIDGQKVWTSYGHSADWIFLLVRTGTTERKHDGITFLLVPMSQEGIEVRPIRMISGEPEFNEVFFDGARTSASNVVGPVGDGWRVAMSLLGYERGQEAATAHVRYRQELDRWLALARSRAVADDPRIRQRLAHCYAKVEMMRYMGLRALAGFLDGAQPGPDAAVFKLYWSEYHQEVTELALDVLGVAATTPAGRWPSTVAGPDDPGVDPLDTASWVGTFLNARAGTIYSGTSQIQRNVIGESVLGLPREPRPRTSQGDTVAPSERSERH